MHRIDWKKERVHKRLASEARTPEFPAAYQDLQAAYQQLRPYPTPESLIGMLHAKAGAGYPEKDGALHALISAVQKEPGLRRCALTLLSLAMWPALEHSYYKLLPLSSKLPDLMEEVYWSFVERAVRFDLAKTSRIPINLQLDVEKAVRAVVTQEARYLESTRAYVWLEADYDRVLEDPQHERWAGLEKALGPMPEREIAGMLREADRARAQDSFGDLDREVLGGALDSLVEKGLLAAEDAALIRQHALEGVELQEIAARLGMQSGALRIRYFRIRARLKDRLDGPEPHVTRSPRNGIYQRRASPWRAQTSAP